MAAMIENGLLLTEVAKVAKTTTTALRAECAALMLHVGVDWAGRPAITQQDAEGLVSGALRRQHDQDLAWRQHQTDSELWEADRARVRQQAWQDAYRVAKAGGAGDPEAGSVGRQAGIEAVETFERTTPAPQWNGQPTATGWRVRLMDTLREAIG